MRKLTVFQKLFIALLVTVSVPIAILGYVSYTQSKDQIGKVTSAFLADNITVNTERLSAFFARLESFSYRVIGHRGLVALLQNPYPDDYFEQVSYANQVIGYIGDLKEGFELFIFPNGATAEYMTWMKLNGFEPGSPVYEKAIEMAGRPFWLHELFPGEDAQSQFVYVRAIRSSNLKPLGVMAIRFPSTFLEKEVSLPTQFADFQLKILNDRGTVLSIPDQAASNTDAALASLLPNGLYGAFSVADNKGVEYYAAGNPLRDTEWTVAALVPASNMMGGIKTIKLITFTIVGVSLFIIAILLYWIVKAFSDPIRRIVRHMKKVEIGDFRPIENYNLRYDEIGHLTRGFNSMIYGMLEQLARTKEMETKRNDLEKQILINQINPHFLYNTLDSIKWKAEAVQEHRIAEMVTCMANMLRFSLMDGDEYATVERELEHVRNYLRVELLRTNNGYDIFYDVEPGILKYRMLKLILQPIAENAVRHGLNRLRDKRGKLIISAYRQGQELVFTIADNGPGSDLSREQMTGAEGDKHSGRRRIGLQNVNSRLRLHFGPSSEAEVITEPGAGFQVVIRHPILPND